MEQELIEILKPLLATSPLALVAFFLYRSGFLSALSSRLKKDGGSHYYNKGIKKLEEWREVVENNHFQDLDELKRDVSELTKDMRDVRERLIRVETKLNGKI